jgi:hypothetical protein
MPLGWPALIGYKKPALSTSIHIFVAVPVFNHARIGSAGGRAEAGVATIICGINNSTVNPPTP